MLWVRSLLAGSPVGFMFVFRNILARENQGEGTGEEVGRKPTGQPARRLVGSLHISPGVQICRETTCQRCRQPRDRLDILVPRF